MDWKWGRVKIDLPADKYGLDEDGWIEMRTRPTARDYGSVGGDDLTMLAGFALDWSLKVGGAEIPFDRDEVLDLPLDIVTAAIETLSANPEAQRFLGLGTGATGSGNSTKPAIPGRKSRKKK